MLVEIRLKTAIRSAGRERMGIGAGLNIELVSVRTSDGVKLDGSLRTPDGSTPTTLGIDCVILHHGTGGRFYGASPLHDRLSDRFLAHGVAVLRVNNRGHDLVYLGPNGLLGSGVETVGDCRHDWAAWNDFAEARGFRRIALAGHSLGAVKTIYYLAEVPDPRVRCAIVTSPPRLSYRTYLSMEGSEQFAADFERAQKLLAAGQPDVLFTPRVPIPVPHSARNYVDKYGPVERYDFFRFVSKVPVPMFMTVGDEGSQGPNWPFWFAFGTFRQEVPDLAARTPLLTFEHILGASHIYDAAAADRVWAALGGWLETVIPPSSDSD